MRYILLKAGATGIALPDGTARDAVAAANIASSTNATPIQVNTSTAHGLLTGAKVYIASHLTNTAANGLWTITKVDADSFTLNDSVGNGVGGATGTVRHDIVTLTDDQYELLSPTALDGDPLIDLGAAPTIDGDEVTNQGVAATTTATAPVAITAANPAAITAANPAAVTYAAPTATPAAITGGESPTETEHNNLRSTVDSIRTQLIAAAADYAAGRAEVVKLVTDLTATRAEVVKLVTDITAVRLRQATIISELVALDAALSGSGKAIAS